MADVLDADGVKIGETRPNQDPNAPQRFVHDVDRDLYFVVPEGKTEAEILAEITTTT